jgi:hypothetical protein
MTELLTMEEIERRFDGEWVVLTDIEDEPGPKIKRARVYWHGADQDEAWDKVGELPKPFHVAVWYMGPLIDDDIVPIL